MFTFLSLPLSVSMKPWLIKLLLIFGKSWMTNVRWYLFRIIIALLRLLDIGIIAKWKGDIFAALQVPPHCIITADGRLGPQKTAENSLFLWSSRIGRQVAGEFKIQDATHLKEKMRLFKKDKGTRLLVIRSGLWRKFVSSSQIFTDPFSLAPGQTHPHYSSWWPRHSVPWCHRFQEPANEERGFDQLTSENTGRESEALLTARLWCVLRKLQGIHQIVSHMFVRQQYSRIFTRDLCLELVIQSRYQRKSSLKLGKLG